MTSNETPLSAEARAVARDVAQHLQHASRVLFVTGAGISVDSGLPTYRGTGGLYSDADTEDGVSIEEALSGPMLQTRPDVSWKHLWVLGEALQGTYANRGHEILAEIEQAKPATWVMTQNVDGFHKAAGTRNLIEIHGRRDRLRCMACEHTDRLSRLYAEGLARPPMPPRCPACDGIMRPGVVLFGEMLPEREIERLEAVLASDLDMVFSIGTSSRFPYIQAPLRLARHQGIPAVEINCDETEATHLATHVLRAGSTEALEAIWRHARTP